MLTWKQKIKEASEINERRRKPLLWHTEPQHYKNQNVILVVHSELSQLELFGIISGARSSIYSLSSGGFLLVLQYQNKHLWAYACFQPKQQK